MTKEIQISIRSIALFLVFISSIVVFLFFLNSVNSKRQHLKVNQLYNYFQSIESKELLVGLASRFENGTSVIDSIDSYIDEFRDNNENLRFCHMYVLKSGQYYKMPNSKYENGIYKNVYHKIPYIKPGELALIQQISEQPNEALKSIKNYNKNREDLIVPYVLHSEPNFIVFLYTEVRPDY